MMTNVEYLRNMSDKKLAAWLLSHLDSEVFCFGMCPASSDDDCLDDCIEMMMEWLKQDHEE